MSLLPTSSSLKLFPTLPSCLISKLVPVVSLSRPARRAAGAARPDRQQRHYGRWAADVRQRWQCRLLEQHDAVAAAAAAIGDELLPRGSYWQPSSLHSTNSVSTIAFNFMWTKCDSSRLIDQIRQWNNRQMDQIYIYFISPGSVETIYGK